MEVTRLFMERSIAKIREKTMAICPECEAHVDIEEDEIEEGQTLDCPECGAELEVVSTNPVELDLVEEEEDEKEDAEEEESW